MTRVGPALSRLAALTLTVFLMVGLIAWVVLPLLRHVDALDRRISVAAEAEAKLGSRLAGLEGREDRVSVLTARIEESDRYLRAETVPLASAAIQLRLSRLAEDNEARLIRTQDVESSDGDGGTRIALRADIAATTNSLMALLYDLEADRPYLFIDSLDVRARPQRVGDGTPRQLKVVLEIAGYLPPVVDP